MLLSIFAPTPLNTSFQVTRLPRSNCHAHCPVLVLSHRSACTTSATPRVCVCTILCPRRAAQRRTNASKKSNASFSLLALLTLRCDFASFTFVVVCFASSTHFFARFRRASQPSNALVQNSGGSSGGGCLLSLTSTRVLSHSDARARFEHLHISRQGCCYGRWFYLQVYRRVKEITGYSGVATYIGHHPVCIQTLLKPFATQDMAWQYHRKGSDCNSVTR